MLREQSSHVTKPIRSHDGWLGSPEPKQYNGNDNPQEEHQHKLHGGTGVGRRPSLVARVCMGETSAKCQVGHTLSTKNVSIFLDALRLLLQLQ